jgi:hypothetical protein
MFTHRIQKAFALLVVSAGTCAAMLCLNANAQQPPQNSTPARMAVADASPSATAQKLPLRRVVLYKSGVGYFEHDGRVRGNEDVEIDLTSSQLDDVLTSLTALDLDGGRIVGASYNSRAPAGYQLAAIPVKLNQPTTLPDFLQQLRGAQLEVHTGAGVFTGQILSIQSEAHGENGVSVDVSEVSLLGDDGEVRSFPLDSKTNLRFPDTGLEQELKRALGLLDSAHQEDTRRLVLSTTGVGDREVRVSYTSEVPVWKTTYRIVLPDKASPAGTKPLLQGWAVVDNTVGEDWNDVELSLAAGAPQSFIQQISQPYYARRPVVGMPQQFASVPQTHGETLVAGQADSADAALVTGRTASGFSGAAPLGRGSGGGIGSGVGGGYGGRGGGGPGSGFVGAAVGSGALDSNGPAGLVADDTEFNYANFAAAAQSINAARGNSLGDLFEYTLKDRVTILKNQSALVPLVQANINAEKVSLWNAGMPNTRPLRALWFTNSTPMVLDGGSFNVLEGGTFVGEGLMEAIQPGEKRLISYAADLAMQVVVKQAPPATQITKLTAAKGLLVQTTESRQKWEYTVRNEDTQPRTLILEHPVMNGWKLVDDLKPEEQSATAYRFRVGVKPKETRTFTVEMTAPKRTEYRVSDVSSDLIEYFVSQRVLTPEIEKSLRDVVAQRDQMAKIQADISAKQESLQQIVDDQGRLRENMKALKGTPEEKALTERYAGELNEQENKLADLRKEIAGTQAQLAQTKATTDTMIEKLVIDSGR